MATKVFPKQICGEPGCICRTCGNHAAAYLDQCMECRHKSTRDQDKEYLKPGGEWERRQADLNGAKTGRELTACKAALQAIEKHHLATGEILWLEPPYTAAAVHESVHERLTHVIAEAEAVSDQDDRCPTCNRGGTRGAVCRNCQEQPDPFDPQ